MRFRGVSFKWHPFHYPARAYSLYGSVAAKSAWCWCCTARPVGLCFRSCVLEIRVSWLSPPTPPHPAPQPPTPSPTSPPHPHLGASHRSPLITSLHWLPRSLCQSTEEDGLTTVQSQAENGFSVLFFLFYFVFYLFLLSAMVTSIPCCLSHQTPRRAWRACVLNTHAESVGLKELRRDDVAGYHWGRNCEGRGVLSRCCQSPATTTWRNDVSRSHDCVQPMAGSVGVADEA